MSTPTFVRIICEGKTTEPRYFQGILKAYGWRGARVHKPKDHSPTGIVREAKREYNRALKAKIPRSNIHVWAVLDRDDHANLKNALQDAYDNSIRVAFSSVCFEYFIVLHFEKCTRPFESCDAVIKYLREKYQQDYGKGADHYDNLKDSFQTAIDNNHWLLTQHLQYEEINGNSVADRNPYTDVYRLLKFLTGLKDPDEQD